MSMIVTPIDWEVIDGYVWCDIRGCIHDDTYGDHCTTRHGLTEFYDIYQDGVLCTKSDHYPVGARLPEGMDL